MPIRFAKPKPAATRYGIGSSTIYDLIAKGNIRAVKAGKCTLVDIASADEYFNSLPAARIVRSGVKQQEAA